MIVADTNLLSEPLRPFPEPRVLAWLAERARDLAIASISVGELRYGAQRLAPGGRRDELVMAIDALVSGAGDRVLSYDAAAAGQYATLRARREAVGRTVSVEDTMVAAVCRAGGHELATRNMRDFADAGLVLHNPWDSETSAPE